MKQEQRLATSQHLTLTPQLKQSLELLQLSSIDLEKSIETNLVDNPLLERSESDNLKIDHEKLVQAIGVGTKSNGDFLDSFEHTIADQESLHEHIREQIRLTSIGQRDRLIAKVIVFYIDMDGYLSATVEEIAAQFPTELEVEPDEVNAVLSLIKTLDPIGFGAHSLEERLLLRLSTKLQKLDKPLNERAALLATKLIKHHLPLLAKRNFKELKNKLDATSEELETTIDLVTGLNPRITAKYAKLEEFQIQPDIIVTQQANDWQAHLNPALRQPVQLNESYLELLRGTHNKESDLFLESHLQKARDFIKSLNNRNQTLLAVAQSIVNQQQAFFESGESHMKPLVLNDVAKHLGLHESTVSRAVNGKYLQCKLGVFELKFFFSSALENSEGEQSSSVAIKRLIKDLISHEAPGKPLSDNKVSQQLKEHGHIVARRTVAKYRESLNIAPSSQRKSLR